MILLATTERTGASGGAIEEVASWYTESGRLQAQAEVTACFPPTGGRERKTLQSPVDAQDEPVIEPSMLLRVLESLVSIAHFSELVRNTNSFISALGPL
jgi:hypothetical protein